MAFALERDDGLILTDDPSRLDFDRVCAWLASAYWADTRDRKTIERSLAASHPYGVYTPDDIQVALARAVTDFAVFAWIGDVIVDEAWRGQGIGTWMMRGVVDDLVAHGVSRIMLSTHDAHEVYRRVGFAPLRWTERWMELDIPATGHSARSGPPNGSRHQG
jgi:GNAT superfamily N-acetyltransferase